MLRKFRVTVNNETYEVLVEEVTENNQPAPAATAAPPAPPTPPPSSSAPAPAAAPATPPAKGEGQSVVSPLPGVVLSINVKVGDQVTAGQTVVILEAMKMENEIPAPINGTVTSILVSKGQSVNTNDVLLTIK